MRVTDGALTFNWREAAEKLPASATAINVSKARNLST